MSVIKLAKSRTMQKQKADKAMLKALEFAFFKHNSLFIGVDSIDMLIFSICILYCHCFQSLYLLKQGQTGITLGHWACIYLMTVMFWLIFHATGCEAWSDS